MGLRLAEHQKIRLFNRHPEGDLSPAQHCKRLKAETDSDYIIDACCSNIVNRQYTAAEHIITTIIAIIYIYIFTIFCLILTIRPRCFT